MLLRPWLVLCVAPLFAAVPPSRGAAAACNLTLDQRIEAQRTIERVYHAHRLGNTLPFDQAVTDGLLERKVQDVLGRSVALEELWGTPITAPALRRELERIASGSQAPERLLEMYEALGNDPFLVMETLARASLVDRLTRSFLAHDERVQAPARREAEAIRSQLVAGTLDASRSHRRRTLVRLLRAAAPAERTPRSPLGMANEEQPRGRSFEIELEPDAFLERRRLLPASPGEPGPVREETDAYVVQAILTEQRDAVEVATYDVPRVDWDSWWAGARMRFDGRRVLPVADTSGQSLPLPGGGRRSDLQDGTGTALATCVEDTWQRGRPEAVPISRSAHSAVWSGSEMIVWGGLTSLGTLASGSRYDPLTDTWISISLTDAPRPRAGHTAVWTGREMIVFGGGPGGGAGVSTGGRYDPVSDTWRPTSSAGASPRTFHSAVWTGIEMIVWGGNIEGSNTGERYDPATDTWRATSTIGAPSPRAGHAAVWTGTEMTVWGGDFFEQTGGRYDPATDTWRATSTNGAPNPRQSPAVVWTGREMIIWGGFGGGYLPTGGRYDPAADTWIPTSLSGAPANRYGHQAVWTGTEMIVWGGIDFSHGPPSELLDTGARYDPRTDAWSAISRIGAPQRRAVHTAVWTGHLMIVWGATEDSSGGRYDPAHDAWTPTSTRTSRPTGRSGHSTVWTGAEMIIWGGLGGGDLSTGGRYDPAIDSWTATSLNGAPPPRAGHAAVWTGSEMIVWGGPDSSGGRYDPMADAWSPSTLSGAPAPRSGHSAVWTGSEMIVWGGGAYPWEFLSDGARYDPRSDSWTPTSNTGAPSPRQEHTAVWTGSEMVIWGGSNRGYLADGARYDPRSDSWTPTSSLGAPSARAAHTAVWTGAEVIVWGGSFDGSGGRYDPADDSWEATTTSGAPAPRFWHSAVWTRSEMIVWGGQGFQYGYYDALHTGGRYDPEANSWSATTTIEAPPGRYGHSAVWTGQAMIVWSGATLTGDVQFNVDEESVRWYGAADPLPVDGDGDGFVPCEGDCDDANANVHPGAVDLPGNLIDEDCDGLAVCSPSASWRTRLDFVRCVAGECARLVISGRATGAQCRQIINATRRSGGSVPLRWRR